MDKIRSPISQVVPHVQHLANELSLNAQNNSTQKSRSGMGLVGTSARPYQRLNGFRFGFHI